MTSPAPIPSRQEVTDEMLTRAVGAYDAVWQWWPDLTAKNVDECRREALRAALSAALAGREVDDGQA